MQSFPISSAEGIDRQIFDTDAFYPGRELMAALNAIFKHPLTIVAAPSGYGQVSAVRCFLERTNAKVLWHRVTGQAPDTLWEDLCEALRYAYPALADALKCCDLRDDQGCRNAADAIESHMRASIPSVMVLEDFQNAPDAVIKLLTTVVKRGIRNLFIVPITTRAFPLNDELLLNGLVNRITMETLALSRQEIVRKFSLGQMELTEEEADFAYSYSEGWLAAVQFLMMCRCANPTLSLVRPDDYDDPFLRAFEQTALEQMPRPSWALLCYLSDQADFTLEEADFFLAFDAESGETARSILQNMIDCSMFISPFPAKRRYRLHPVLRRTVQKRILPRLSAGRHAEICARKALWHEQNGRFDRALHHYDLAGDDAACLRVLCCLTRFQDIGVSAGLIRRLFDSFRRTREAKEAPPALTTLMALARYAALMDEGALYAEILREIDALARIPDEFTGLYGALRHCAPERLHARLLMLDDKPGLAALSDCFDVSYGVTSLLWALPPSSSGLNQRCALWKDFAGPGSERGDLFAGASHLLFAELQFLRGNFTESEIYLHAAIRNARGAGNPGVWITACCTLARLRCFLGDSEGAHSLLSDARLALERECASRLDATLDLCAYSIAILEGHPERVEPWLLDEAEVSRRLYAPARRELLQLRRLTLLFERRYAEYISYCMEEDAEPEERGLLSSLLCKLGLSYAYDRAGLPDSALKALDEALDAAEPEGLYAPFVPLRHWIRSLPGAQEDARCASALCRIDPLSDQSRYSGQASGAPEPIDAPEPADVQGQTLTRRETEIVACLRKGASNREIAQRLYISENTVKSILKKLYAKLSINSRYDLIRTPGEGD